MQQVEYGEISGVSFISVVRQKVTWNAWNLIFFFAKKQIYNANKKGYVFLSYEKISWNLNAHCDLTSFEVKKLHVFAQFFISNHNVQF